jgi:Ca-activated chloride channel family protein
MSRRHEITPAIVAAALVAALAAQEPAPASLRILAPADGTVMTGRVRLAASVEPPGATTKVKQVTFYVDGRSVCVDDTPATIECTWEAGTDVRAHVVRVVADMTDRPRLVASVQTRGLDYAEKVSVNVIQINAIVTEGGSKYVRGLPRSAFRVLEDDVPQRISHFAAEGTPLELVLAIDVSGSMSLSVPQLKTAVKKFLATISSRDRVTLLAFNDSVYTLSHREADPAARAKAVDRLAAWGGTSLYDVVIKAFGQVSKEPGRHAVVLFTDGEDRTSLSTLDAVEARIKKSDATLFAVALGRGSKVEAFKAVLERLAHATGGRAIFTERAETLDEPFGKIMEELSNQYLLGYEPTNIRRDGAWRRIRVETTDKRYKVRARLGYTADSR